MKDDTTGHSRDPLYDAARALEDLTSALMDTPEAYEVFLRLSPSEQVGLVEWIDNATDPRNRERRLNMICVVLARSAAAGFSRQDTAWLDGQALDPD